ncbi:protein phosphatase 1 regulatory subunit 3D [Falco biarmicus]|uniref:protein phosphatase 1 regulatory subunit 3D n=1 Tax=Falco rusticolus TaxID=120794 RepID=UPI001886933F|nr:protein phosphatase 1 regulatory subunit 3D [Falco rusticolus]XP_056210000.1 protein phosphatase 1 regulatory subunit 3D [Falco biarmicus]
MEVRGPRRNPSYLSDLYQNMLRAEEARGRGQQQPPAVHTSSSKALWSSTLAKGGPQPSKLQSSTSSSCDPALRPIIRRRARSLPTSPERRKRAAAQCQVPGCQSRINRVRFADALGLELTEVKVFQTGEDPSIPLHVLSRLSINSDLWCSSSDLEFSMQCLVPDFQQPADSMDFSSRLQEQQVCLERVTSSDLGLSGTIQVRNIAFEKQVSVRYTFNQWKSLHEVCAHWRSSIPEKNGQDQVDVFTFFLPVPPFLLQLCSVVQFAARYQVNGQEYWDNNRGKNYTLTCRIHPLKMPRECEESWIHFI